MSHRNLILVAILIAFTGHANARVLDSDDPADGGDTVRQNYTTGMSDKLSERVRADALAQLIIDGKTVCPAALVAKNYVALSKKCTHNLGRTAVLRFSDEEIRVKKSDVTSPWSIPFLPDFNIGMPVTKVALIRIESYRPRESLDIELSAGFIRNGGITFVTRDLKEYGSYVRMGVNLGDSFLQIANRSSDPSIPFRINDFLEDTLLIFVNAKTGKHYLTAFNDKAQEEQYRNTPNVYIPMILPDEAKWLIRKIN